MHNVKVESPRCICLSIEHIKHLSMSNECFTLQMLIALAELLWDQLKTQRRTPSGNSSKVQQPFNSRSVDDLLAFLDGPQVEGDECFVCVVIHNIDGPGLRDPETQQYLARMAACSHICVVASIDHVNAPLCKYLFVIVLYLIEKDPIFEIFLLDFSSFSILH